MRDRVCQDVCDLCVIVRCPIAEFLREKKTNLETEIRNRLKELASFSSFSLFFLRLDLNFQRQAFPILQLIGCKLPEANLDENKNNHQ